MPVIWGQHNNSEILIDVAIIDVSYIDSTNASTPLFGVAIDSRNLFRALIDTGAQKTMISTNVINQLGLAPVGKILIAGVGPTAHYHNGYLFNVAFVTSVVPSPSAPPQDDRVRALVNVNRNTVYGAEIDLQATGGMFDVLLGMDILSDCQLVVGHGIFSLSY